MSLVADQAWMYFVEVRSALGSESIVEKIIIPLIESGFIYRSLWILVLVTRYCLLSDLMFDVVCAVLPHPTAIYPVSVIPLSAQLSSTKHSGRGRDVLPRYWGFFGFIESDEHVKISSYLHSYYDSPPVSFRNLGLTCAPISG
ncbi:hypothetical protein BDZ94DRAFT_1239470 [Collybia nuda]|uniref:Uncharacterized protein n=1 Tax=Collybia nuda TaxID=64659 RepID=A0A9P5XYL1_9AGAR|nr:hypothetical protein BDZ94DRAFT_1239470 [Collybia nuda]